MVTTESPDGDEAGDHAVVEHDADGRVTGFAYKPDEPGDGHDRRRDLRLRPRGAARGPRGAAPRARRPTATRATPGWATSATTCCRGWSSGAGPTPIAHDGYWRDLGQPHHYLRAHHDVLTDDVGVLAVPGWPMLSRQPQRVPARVLEGAGRRQPALARAPASPGRSPQRARPGRGGRGGRRGARQRGLRRPVVRAGRGSTGRSSTRTAWWRPTRGREPDADLDDPDAVTRGRGSVDRPGAGPRDPSDARTTADPGRPATRDRAGTRVVPRGEQAATGAARLASSPCRTVTQRFLAEVGRFLAVGGAGDARGADPVQPAGARLRRRSTTRWLDDQPILPT